MPTILKLLIVLMVFQLPGRLRAIVFKRWLGWDIHPTACVGLSIVAPRHLSMSRASRIGHFNVIRSLNTISLDDSAVIGQLNWITAEPTLSRLAAKGGGTLTLGRYAAVTSRHFIDCPGGVEIGDYTIVAGIRSTILSHQFDLVESRQTVLPVAIGAYCFLSSDVRVTPGSTIADRCLVAMGAVVAKDLEEPGYLYGGVPARALRRIEDARYFRDPSDARWAHLDIEA